MHLRRAELVFYSMIVHRGRLYTVESNQGEVLSTNVNGDIRRDIDVSASQGHIVPTSLAERDDLFYLGSLNLFPIVVNSAPVITLSRRDDYYNFAPGLNPDREGWWKLKPISSKAGFATIVATAFGPDGPLSPGVVRRRWLSHPSVWQGGADPLRRGDRRRRHRSFCSHRHDFRS
jgi:hypothetical protein